MRAGRSRLRDDHPGRAGNQSSAAPVSVRARVLVAHDEAGDLEAPGAQTDTVVDMSALGFADEIARPDELYDRYGAPECDPAWRP